jgi:hypothetical protein
MDKYEAERLAAAIQASAPNWIQVRAIELNRLTQHYEVRCVYKLGAPFATNRWDPVQIKSPTQWTELLREQR